LTSEQASRLHFFFMMARQQGQSLAKRFPCISPMMGNQCVCCVFEQGNHFFIYFFELSDRLPTGRFDNVFRLGHTNFFELDSGLVLNLLDESFLFQGIKSYASARSSSSCGTA